MSREGRAPRLVEPEEMVPPLRYVVSRAADNVNGWRFDANLSNRHRRPQTPSAPPASNCTRSWVDQKRSLERGTFFSDVAGRCERTD